VVADSAKKPEPTPSSTEAAFEPAMRLDVTSQLLAKARVLAPILPDEITLRGAPITTAEEAVLQAALRLGMASLAALAELDDET
jgi:hypothetical protein